MLRVHETTTVLPFFRPLPLTPLPLIYQREHLFPYTSAGDTATTPVPREFRMVVLENDFLRVEVAPELGGRVHSLFDKRAGKEILFRNPVVKPVRVLPVWSFLSGGIEFNFPIAHSPTSASEVGCSSGLVPGYGFVRVGEREARTGMEWVVELGLAEDLPALVQRTRLRNATTRDHPWMWWTICGVPSTPRTEFVHPPHRVLVHDDKVAEADWPGDGRNWEHRYRQMTALFWKPGSAPAFGVFHHDLGHGLMHLADPARLPGKKVWTYGHGAHREWAKATTEGDFAYCEIESGPLFDQSEKPLLPAGAERAFDEFWLPVHSRAACDNPPFPQAGLPPLTEPWLGWHHSPWQAEWERFRQGDGPLPESTVPTGIELEDALRAACRQGTARAAEALALWLAFHDRPREARDTLAKPSTPTACRVAGLIEWKALGRPESAATLLEAGPLHDHVAVAELDQLYTELGWTNRRVKLLAGAPGHRLLTERRADLALALGDPAETLRLLRQSCWPREHQRYVRSTLWRAAHDALGEDPGTEVPDWLHEDNLATFGAYWSD